MAEHYVTYCGLCAQPVQFLTAPSKCKLPHFCRSCRQQRSWDCVGVLHWMPLLRRQESARLPSPPDVGVSPDNDWPASFPQPDWDDDSWTWLTWWNWTDGIIRSVFDDDAVGASR